MRALYAVLLTATVVACASIQPVAVQTGDRCLRCRRAISDTRLAGEIVDQMRAPFPFRTAGCMAVYVKANDPAKFAAIFVTDYKTGKLFDADDAYFVATVLPAEGLKNENDYVAFRSRADADGYRKGSEPVLRWAEVVAKAAE